MTAWGQQRGRLLGPERFSATHHLILISLGKLTTCRGELVAVQGVVVVVLDLVQGRHPESHLGLVQDVGQSEVVREGRLAAGSNAGERNLTTTGAEVVEVGHAEQLGRVEIPLSVRWIVLARNLDHLLVDGLLRNVSSMPTSPT